MAAIKQKQEKNLDEYRKLSIDGGGEIPFLGLADPIAMEIDDNSRSSSEGRNHDERRPDLEMEMAAYKDGRVNHQPHIQPSSFSFSVNGFLLAIGGPCSTHLVQGLGTQQPSH